MKRYAGLHCNHHPIQNPILGAWIAMTVLACRLGKAASGRAVLVATFAGAVLFAPPIHAAPDGGQVSAGAGSITQTGTTTTITQQTQNLAIDWNTFSIAAGESVNFIQPGSTSIALNRILGTSPSEIFGSLSANGQVFILNPNGVLFGQGAQVNVGGLVASTLGLSNADFLAGNYRFSNGGSAGAVVNQGTITAADGGYIALLAPEVRNEGVISAKLGTALLAAGNMVTLNLDNGSLLGFSVDQGTLNALAENRHLIQADGGQVFMSAKAADALGTAVVNNTGIIEARTVQNIGGVIKLMGDMQVGQVNVGGTLDASAPDGGNGGFIETSAAQVNVANDARVTTLAAQGANGTWLIDPFDFTIAAAGGNMTGAAVGAALAGGNFTILSSNGTTGINGDINVNDVVSWSANTLTLNAQRDININASLNGSGTAQLTLLYGQGAIAASNTSSYVIAPNVQVNLPAGNNFSTKLGSDGGVINYTVITSLGAAGSTTGTDLQGMNGNLAGNYVLGADIDAATTSTWNPDGLGGYFGFAPIGDNSSNSAATQFAGTFDGLGHTISNLTINWQASSYVGLFGYAAAGSSIRNVGLLGGSVAGSSLVGGLVGYNSGTISNAYTTGNVTSNNDFAGGLAGYNNGIVTKSYSTANVNGSKYIGGLIGNNYGSLSTSHATGTVTGSSFVGGLVGANVDGTISNSYATGSVNGNNAGGLVGQNSTTGIISGSYAAGTVTGSTYTGGLVGINYGVIGTSYATGSANGNTWAGGLVGYNTGTISTTYAAGIVSGTTYVGGVAGYNTGTISSSYYYWDATLPQPPGIGGGTSLTGTTALTTAQMMTMSSFSGWNIANTGGAGKTWRIYENHTAPLLTSLLIPQVTVTASDAVKTYDGNAYTGGNGVSYSDPNAVTTVNVFDSSIAYGGTSQNAVNTGSYTITVSGLYSNQQGYDTINYAPGTLTVSPYVVNLSGSRSYDGTNIISSADLVIPTLVGSETLILSGNGLMAHKHAGTGKAITSLDTLALGSDTGLASNYTLVGGTHAVNITPAPLSINAGQDSKTYDGTTTSAALVTIGTMFGSDSVTGATQAFVSKNVLGTNGSTLRVTGYTVIDGNGGANYLVTENTATGTIAPATITVNANNNGKVIGDSDPAPITTASYSGFVPGEDQSVLTGSLVVSRVPGEAVGDYNINVDVSGLSAANYTITASPVQKIFTIYQVNELLIKMAGMSKEYGTDPTTLFFTTPVYAKYNDGVTVIDLLAGVTPPINSNNWTLNDGSTFTATTDYGVGNTNVGTYTISAGSVIPAVATSYVVTDAALTITPAPLTISANAATKTYGDSDPTLTYNYNPSDFKFTDTATSVLNGALSRATGENVGSYAISQGTLAANSNYTINYTGNNLSIGKAPLSILVNNSTKTYGQTATFSGYDIVGLQFGETIVSVTLDSAGAAPTAPVNSGLPYTITSSNATGGTFNVNNYDNITYGTGQLTVNPAPLTVTANPATKNYDGMPYSGGNGVVYSGLVNGELSTNVLGGTLTYGGNSQGASIPGTYQITPGGLTSGNYTISYVSGALTINATNPATVALGGDALVLAYNAALQGIANTDARKASNPPGSSVEPIGIVGCGVAMPPDAPANTCQN